MADIDWPTDLIPFRVAFYLQPHVGGSESPLTRTRKVYGLTAPRWVARLTFRGGYDGAPLYGSQAGYGPRLDALVAQLEGGLELVRFHDFRRPRPVRPQSIASALTVAAASKGATSLAIAGFSPNSVAFSVGDYVGGDGRPHMVTGGMIMSGAVSIMADSAGVATVTFRPPLSADVAAGPAVTNKVTAPFQLVSEDAGENETEVGDLTTYTLDFVEYLP